MASLYEQYADFTNRFGLKTKATEADINALLPATSKPSGLTIAREGRKLICNWNIPSTGYGYGQQMQYRLKTNGSWTRWTSVAVGKTDKAKSINLTLSDYYPNANKPKLSGVEFRVRGKRKLDKKKKYTKVGGMSNLTIESDECQWSAWADKSYNILNPNRPVLTKTPDSISEYKCAFSWKTEVSDKKAEWFSDVLYQSILVKDCTVTDGSKLAWKSSTLGWKTGTGTANGEIPNGITENSALLANASYTRWVRVCARGIQGDTGWVYINRVYAAPNKTTPLGTPTVADNGSGGLNITQNIKAQKDASTPIDSISFQYAIVTPTANMGCPSGASWTTVQTISDTKKRDTFSVNIDASPGLDQCLFVRSNTVFEGKTTWGAAVLTKKGTLRAPTNLSVQTNVLEHKATITATNACTVPGAFLAVEFVQKGQKAFVAGIIPSGSTSITVQCPDWGNTDPAFNVYAVVGSYTVQTKAGVNIYALSSSMESEKVSRGGNVPLAPTGVTAVKSGKDGILVKWNWTWTEADAAQLSWSDHDDAWQSTDEPSTYTVSNLYSAQWTISGLETGKIWYVRVRLVKENTYGPWSTMVPVNLSEKPNKPMLSLSRGAILNSDTFTAYWDYASEDDTPQAHASICEISGDDHIQIAQTQTAQHADIKCPGSWAAGSIHQLCVRVTSGSGLFSEWSDPAAITVVTPIEADITDTSLTTITVGEGEEAREVTALTEMPLTATITGAGSGGITTLIIERAEDYRVDRPDGSEYVGFEGETIAIYRQLGEAAITVRREDLTGILDDGAAYRLIATVQDGYGQSDTKEIDFEVHWAHQAIMPEAEEAWEGTAVYITPIAPAGAVASDRCDIYRLSADEPVLIYKDAEFGQTYVDPYPAMNDFGGHRIVFKTANGDYITEDNTFAWIDIGDAFITDYSLIDFGGRQISLQLNMRLSHSWKKDFTETKYLGGSVQGDWNPAVSRSTSVSAVAVLDVTDEDIVAMRELAAYPGICHVRTPDGSSFAADIQVSESRSYQSKGRKLEYTLNITRVDPEGYEAVLLGDWNSDGME